MSDKGFIHVLEAILVALVLIVTLPFLLFPTERETAWDVASLTVTGEDVLATLDGINYAGDNESYAQDILEDNATTVDNQLRRVLGTTSIGYGVNVRGSLKNEVRIGCNCSQDQANTLEQILTPANVNGRRIIFRVFPYDLGRLGTLDFDVILLNGSAEVQRFADFYNSSEENERVVLDHMRKRHGIVEVFDPTTAVIDSPLQREVFGLVTTSSINGVSGFLNNADANKTNYAIGKYFYGVGTDLNFSGVSQKNLILRDLNHLVRKNTSNGPSVWAGVDIDLDRNDAFTQNEMNFSPDARPGFTIGFGILPTINYNFTVDKIDTQSNFAHFNIVRHPGEYNFTDTTGDPTGLAPISGSLDNIVVRVPGASGRNHAIINEFEGGRAVWLTNSRGDDYRGLLKSSVIWAAGEDWNILPRSVTARQVRVSHYVAQGEEFFEPYWIELTLWFLF